MPWHESIDPRDRPALRDPFESLREPGVRIDIVHLRGLQKLGNGRPGPAATMAARKERIFVVMVCGRIAHSMLLEAISIRSSLRNRSRTVRLDVA